MKQFLLSTLFMFCAAFVSAQDVIVKKDGSTILSKVLEVNQADIKYKKHTNLGGPTYTIDKKDVLAINYQNGDKDTFDTIIKSKNQSEIPVSSSTGLIKKIPDGRNSEIIKSYNVIYQPSKMVETKNKAADHALVIFGVKEKSILSNDDIEIELIWKEASNPWDNKKTEKFCICIKNKTDKTIYIDKGNCFNIDEKGESHSYYDISQQTTVTNGSQSGISLGLGSVANVLGIGGAIGTLAGGVGVGGGNSSSVSTTYVVQRIIAIPPHGKKNLTEYNYVNTRKASMFNSGPLYRIIEDIESFGFISYNVVKKGIVNKGQMKSFGENELPWKREYYVTYSTDANFVSYSTLNFELYIHELIGVSGKIYDATQNYQYIEKMNDHTLNKVIELL